MADVSKLQVVVGADTKDAESALGRLTGTISSGFGIAAGTKLLEAGLGALGGGIKATIGEATDFQKQLSGIKAVSGASAEEMDALSKLSLRLGADTSFSAKESAKGIEELVKGGVSIADIMGGAAKASLDLAAAGEIDVADAATIASNAMAQFGIKGSEMGRVSDLIAGAANASSLSVGDFKYSLQAAGAVASTVGFSFDDLAQGIAIMGKAGITGSDAGTSLKTMMMSLEPSTKRARNLMAELGIITADGSNKFFDASGKVKSMAEVSQVLQDALAGQTEQQKLANLETLFGSDAIRAAAVLSKEGATGFETMAEAMTKVTAASVAEERLNNLSGSLEKFKGSMSTASVLIGRALLGPLQKLVDWGTEILNKAMPNIEAFAEQLPGAIDATVSAVSQFVATYWPPFREALASLWDWLSPKIGEALAWLQRDGWPMLINAATTVVDFIRDPLIPIIGSLVNWLSVTLGDVIKWFIDYGWPKLVEAARALWSFFSGDLINGIGEVARNLREVLRPATEWFTNEGWPALKREGETVKGFLTETNSAWTTFNNTLKDNDFYTDLNGLFREFKDLGKEFVDMVVTPLKSDLEPVTRNFEGLGDILGRVTANGMSLMVTQARLVIQQIRDVITIVKTALDWFRQLRDAAGRVGQYLGIRDGPPAIEVPDLPEMPTPDFSEVGGVNAMATGGLITEPIFGVGRSGQRYLLGESGPEYVTPARSMAPSSMSVPIVIGGRVIEELWITGRDLAVRRGRVPVGATI